MMSLWGALLMVLVLGAAFVNGWTDAPNAIASAVATKAISFRGAVWLAAGCNLLGLLLMSLISVSVADTISSMTDFGGCGPAEAVKALCAVMAAIVIFAVCAWYFGIPTSESHALMAALAGASFALGGGGPRGEVWAKIIAGLLMSLLAGFFFSFVLAKKMGGLLKKTGAKFLDRLQVLAACAMAIMHGAQDGQKFAAILVAACLMAKDVRPAGSIRLEDHAAEFVICALCIALGTSVGGKRIVQSVGVKMVPLQKYQGVCADLGSSICLFAASVTGIPMSTTHTKTAAIMGAGIAENRKAANSSIIRGMLAAWAFTFPVCGAIAYLLTGLFLAAA